MPEIKPAEPKKIIPGDRANSGLQRLKPTSKPEKKKLDSGKQSITKDHDNIVERLCADDIESSGDSDVDSLFAAYGSKVLSSQGKGGRNILHTLIEHWVAQLEPDEGDDGIEDSRGDDGEEAGDVFKLPDLARDFLELLIIKHPDVLHQSDLGRRTPLEAALALNKSIFFFFIDLIAPDDIVKKLNGGHDWSSSLETVEAERFKRIAACFQTTDTRIPHKVTANSQEPRGQRHAELTLKTMGQDRDDERDPNTGMPIRGPNDDQETRSQTRVTIDEKRLKEWSEQLLSCIQSALGLKEDGSSCLHMLLQDQKLFALSSGATEDSSGPRCNFDRLIAMCPEDVLKTNDLRTGFTPLHHAISLYSYKQIDFRKINRVITQIVDRVPSTVFINSTHIDQAEPLTPYRHFKAICKRRGNEWIGNKKECAHEVESFLKSAVIRDGSSRNEKIEHLYGGPKEAKRLFFDIPRVKEKVGMDYINALKGRLNLNFDTLLDYVRLPEHEAQGNNPVQDIMQQQRNRNIRLEPLPEDQCDPYVKIFDWLAQDQHIKKIFKIVVDDMGPNPHSDEGIRNSLTEVQNAKLCSRFDMEVWNWRKLDICSDTISIVAPNVRELFLYSSGNPAIFKSWACKDGLAKLQKLQKVTINIFCRRKDDNACKEAAWLFEKKFSNRRPDCAVSCEYVDTLSAGQFQDEDMKMARTKKNFDTRWLHKSALFRKEMNRVPSQQSVKIALIDDGVNAAQHGLGKITEGVSYYAEDKSPMGFRDYWTGPSEHGTQMAMCIREVCPMAELYVARMDDSNPGLDKFTVKSAIDSLRWAVTMGVDIISMSWSFNWKDPLNEQYVDAFKNAISEAKEKNILLFGSMNDIDAKPDMEEYYPASLSEVICIGSADPWSGKANHNAGRTSEYLFPGEKITLPNSKGESITVSGSSLATAFAAGLSGLVLFSIIINESMVDGGLSENTSSTTLSRARTKEGMSKIFDVLGDRPGGAPERDLYVGLGKLFPQDEEMFSPQKFQSTLQQFVRDICQRV